MTVSRNPDPLVDFAKLSPAEQTAVAERLIKIEESGWKPFWCPDPHCDGMPHVVLDDDGEEMLVGHDVAAGPNGEPVSDLVYETPDGEWFLSSEYDKAGPDDTPVGRLVYEPQWAHNHAREDQRLLPWSEPWILFIMSGRGAGKTRTGIEFVTLCARKGLDGAIVGRRGTELVNTHVAEIIKFAHPEFKPEHFASKDILVWPNGAITYLFSAERPENIRSVNLSYCWFDEAAWMDEIESAWDNAKFATRVKSPGNPIHFLITSTPTGTPWVQEMEDDPDVTVRRVSTYANKANLDPDYIAELRKKYEGTRKGRQELHGEVLRDVEGAMWNDEMFKQRRLDPVGFHFLLFDQDDRVIAVDPAGSKGKRSDATGIIGVGVQHNDEEGEPLPVSRYSVLLDATLKGTPTEWACQTFKAARLIHATRIIAEKNYGGEMVLQTLKDYAKLHPDECKNADGEQFKIELVHAAESKETRAEPTVGKYEQGLVTHITSELVIGSTVVGDLSQLEKEQVTWVPKSRGGRLPSPNRVDALVWAIRACESALKYKAQTANSRDVLRMLRRRGRGAA